MTLFSSFATQKVCEHLYMHNLIRSLILLLRPVWSHAAIYSTTHLHPHSSNKPNSIDLIGQTRGWRAVGWEIAAFDSPLFNLAYS